MNMIKESEDEMHLIIGDFQVQSIVKQIHIDPKEFYQYTAMLAI